MSHSDYDQQYWHPEVAARRPWWKSLWYAFLVAIGFLAALTALLVFFLWCMFSEEAHGADRRVLPPIIVDGPQINRFGTYSDEYYARRWRRMCAGPARYDAMREADERGKSNPCS